MQVYDTEGFKLITTIVEHMSLGLLQPYLSTVLNLMMMRMQSSRTAKVGVLHGTVQQVEHLYPLTAIGFCFSWFTLQFVHSFFVFTCFLCGKLGGSFVVALTDG